MQALILLVAALIPLSGLAGVYKWTDAQGQVHYSDTPPPSQPTQQLRTPKAGAEAEEARRALADKLSESERRRLQAQEEETKRLAKEDQLRKQQESCKAARDRLSLLQQSGRIARVNAQGQRYFLEEPERQAAIAESQQQVTERCK